MDTKLRSTIAKIQQEKAKGNHARALARLSEAVKQHPDCVELYREAVDTSLEAAESLQTIDYLKRALSRFPAEREGFVCLARDRASASNDEVVAKFLVEHSVKRRELLAALAVLEPFPDRTVRDLLQRARMKRHTLASAARGGHAVTDEIMTNMLSEVVVAARSGRLDEAVATVLEILDATPGEAGSLEPLLEGVGDPGARPASVLFAMARCALIASRQKEAMEKLVASVQLDRGLGPDALDLLRTAGEDFDEVPAPIEDATVEILMITGAFDRAAEIVRRRFEAHPGQAAYLVELVGRHLPRSGDAVPLHFLFLDVAVEADRMGYVFDVLSGLKATEGNRAGLLEWLDDVPKNRFLSADAMILHAELADDDGNHERAARILRAVCAATPADVPRVIATLRPRAGDNDLLRDLLDELSTPAVGPDESEVALAASAPPVVGADAFEHFENNEFRFSSRDSADDGILGVEAGEEPPPALHADASPGTGAAPGLDGFDIYDGANILGTRPRQRSDRPRPIASVAVGTRRPLDTDRAGIIWEEEGEAEPGTEVAAPAPNAPGITEDHVRNIAAALYASGARTFFYIEGEGTPTAPVSSPEAESPEEGAPSPPTADSSFEERFSRFQEGGLDPEAVVALMEHAAENHFVDELVRLVEFVPDDDGLRARRALCEVELHLTLARPVAALDALKRLREADLGEEQRKSIWLKTVECQRMMRDYDAAHRTLVDLVRLYPECPEVARLAKLNYDEYLQCQCTDAPVLEKVTSLDGDS